MEETKNIIATIRPTFIEGFDFVFAKDTDGTYASKFRASITLKVGLDARKLDFVCDSIYHPSEYGNDENGNRVCLKESYDEPYIGLDRYSHTLDDLTKVGIEVDLKEVIDVYALRVEEAKLLNEAIKAENTKKAYDSSWIHEGMILFGEMKKKPAGMTALKSKLGEIPYITLTYKEETVNLTRERIRGGEQRFKIYGRITPGYDGKYYKTVDTAVLKFAAFVDASKNLAALKLTQEEKAKAERAAKAKKLSEIFGLKVIVTKEYKYYSYSGARRGRDQGYFSYDFWLVAKPEVKDGENVITEATKIKIIEEYKHNDQPQTYSIGGFGKLSLKKVLGIVNAWISEE